MLIGIVAATIAAVALGLAPQPGFFGMPPSVAPTFFAMQFGGASGAAIATVVFVFLLIDMLDTSGTLTARRAPGASARRQGAPAQCAPGAGQRRGRATMIGAALGTSPVTAYIDERLGHPERRAHGG